MLPFLPFPLGGGVVARAPTLTLPDYLLAAATSCYAATWTVDVTVGAETETWTPNTTSARDAVDGLLAWLNDAARPWYPVGWDATLARDATTGGALLSIEADTSWTWEASGSNPLGIPTTAPTAAETMTATDPAEGTWCPAAGIAYRNPRPRGTSGDGGNGLSVMRQPPATLVLQPRVESVATALEAGRLADCMARLVNPRICYLHDRGTWYTLAAGRADRTAVGSTHYRVTLDCAQEV